MTDFSPTSDDFSRGYFYWLFDRRFDCLLRHYREYLHGKGIVGLEPIVIRAFPCKEVLSGNIHVLGHADPGGIIQLEPEVLNQLFSLCLGKNGADFHPHKAPSAGSQARIPLIAFTTRNIVEDPRLEIHGPNPALVDWIDSKVTQFHEFCDLSIPCPPYRTCSNFSQVEKRISQYLCELGPVVIQPERTSGGAKACLIKDSRDLGPYRAFLEGISPGDSEQNFLLTKYMAHSRVPSCNMVITKQGRLVLVAMTELLFNGFRFDGFIYPIFWGETDRKRIMKSAMRIGRYLADRGYWGFFAVDFLLQSDGKLYFTELNPRYTCEALYLFSIMKGNLFSVMDDDTDPEAPLIDVPEHRVMISKIRPEEGKQYSRPFVSTSRLDDFIDHKVDRFREYYWPGFVQVKYGSYLGLCGARFGLKREWNSIVQFYLQEREER